MEAHADRRATATTEVPNGKKFRLRFARRVSRSKYLAAIELTVPPRSVPVAAGLFEISSQVDSKAFGRVSAAKR